MSTVKERLLEFLKEERISASEFTKKMGLSSTYIASMRKSMPEEKVERLTQLYPQLNRDWLLYGEGKMYRPEIVTKGIEPYRLHRHMVPLVPTQAKAGSLDFYAESVNEENCPRIYSPSPDARLAIQVNGDSMEPHIQNGAYLFLEKINEKSFIPWGSPLVLDTENGSVVKLLYPSEKGENYLLAKSYNPNYPPFVIPTESIYGIYRILCQMKEGVTF
ncbi:MAG: LexA family transcriptional regulator [Muribaculaceae bacterium]|nr:LexA family transcriptional regulator [Muribaculaceae bacterium]